MVVLAEAPAAGLIRKTDGAIEDAGLANSAVSGPGGQFFHEIRG